MFANDKTTDNLNDKIKLAFDNLRLFQELIRFMDQKAGAIFIIQGSILTIYIQIVKELTFYNPFSDGFNGHDFLPIMIFLFSLSLVGIMIWQIQKVLLGIIAPRLASNYSPKELSLFYFEHISLRNKTYFINKYKELNQEAILEEILAQQYELSIILSKKTKQVSRTIPYLLVMIFLLCSLILFIHLSEV